MAYVVKSWKVSNDPIGEQRNNVKKIVSVGLAIFTSGMLLFTSACSESNSKPSNSKGVYESLWSDFSIVTNGFEVLYKGDDRLILELPGTEIQIYIQWTEKENIEEYIAEVDQRRKEEGFRVLKEKKTKNSLEVEEICVCDDALMRKGTHYYCKLIQGEGKLFTISTYFHPEAGNNESKKLMKCLNSFSVTKPSENKGRASAFVGRWKHEGGATYNKPESLELLKDGTGVCDETSISWKVDGKRFIITSSRMGLAGDYRVSDSRLVLLYDDGSRATFRKLSQGQGAHRGREDARTNRSPLSVVPAPKENRGNPSGG